MNYSYSGMCQDGHQQIGDNDTSDDDRCPYCRAIDLLIWIRECHVSIDVMNAIDKLFVDDRITRDADSQNAGHTS